MKEEANIGESSDAGAINSVENTSVITMVKKIGDSTPIQDFEAMMSHRESPEWVGKAIKEMKNKIFDLVQNSNERDNHLKALDCLVAFRKGCILEQVSFTSLHSWLSFCFCIFLFSSVCASWSDKFCWLFLLLYGMLYTTDTMKDCNVHGPSIASLSFEIFVVQKPTEFSNFLLHIYKFCKYHNLNSFCESLASNEIMLIPKTEVTDRFISSSHLLHFIPKVVHYINLISFSNS